jgi:hypothetical protein
MEECNLDMAIYRPHTLNLYGVFLKQKIKTTYTVILSKNIMHFYKEAEYKYIIKEKSYDEKIKDFFECFTSLDNVADKIIPYTNFYQIQAMIMILIFMKINLIYSYKNKFI